jgi:hypothetical protein
MKSSVVLGLMAAIGAAQQFQSGREDLDGGKTREQVGRKSTPLLIIAYGLNVVQIRSSPAALHQRCRA